MTGVAIGGGVIESVGMARVARHRKMCPGERKLREVVIVGRRDPGCGGVTLRAFVAEVVLHMIGVGQRVVILLVTGVAIGGDILITSRMAGDTLQIHVRPRQRELSIIVIEYTAAPVRSVMTEGAIVGEVIPDMVGIVGVVKIGLMAGNAVSGRVLVSAGMAGDTWQGDVSPC